jgi:perosamine synthetase
MIPYAKHAITPDDEAAVLRALRSDHLTQGPEVEAFEAELAEVAGARYAVAVNSGTAALATAYGAIGEGWYVPAISFVATANAVLHAEYPVGFSDCNPDTGLVIGPHPDVGVTLGGQPVSGRLVDACHGPLRHLGALATCFSFHPAKHVAAGEGGAVVTNDQGLADEMRLLRAHGREGTRMVRLGWNHRMPEPCAALARSQLRRYRDGVTIRRQLAAEYDRAFAGHPVIRPVPHTDDSARHLYQVLLPDPLVGHMAHASQPLPPSTTYREDVASKLRERGIGTAIHYPVIPLQPYYRDRYGYRPGQFPGAESHAARTLSLPLYPTLQPHEQRQVIDALLEVCG